MVQTWPKYKLKWNRWQTKLMIQKTSLSKCLTLFIEYCEKEMESYNEKNKTSLHVFFNLTSRERVHFFFFCESKDVLIHWKWSVGKK